MKKLAALLLALVMSFSVCAVFASAGEIPEDLDLGSLPEFTLGQPTTGLLEGETELWYQFTAEESGYYYYTVDGARYDVYYLVDYGTGDVQFSAASKGVYKNWASMSAGETQYIRIYNPAELGDREFSVSIEGPFSLGYILSGVFGSFLKEFADVSLLEILANIGMLPVFGIMFGFFFTPFSMGGTLIVSLISALLLPVTLLLSPFMLIQEIKDFFA